MNKDLEVLQLIQKLDLEIDQIQTNQIEYPKQIDRLKQKLKAEQSAIENQMAHMNDLERKRKNYELDLKQNDQKIKLKEQKLLSIKSNDEYQALKSEIEQIKQENSVIEDQIFELLIQIEKSGELLKISNKQFQKDKEEIEGEISLLEKELSTLDGQLSTQKILKEKEVSNINNEVYATYNRIRSKEPLAVTDTQKSKCGGCAMTLPPQLYNIVQRGENISFCPSCQRILIYKKNEA